ncbi:MAG: hypothetical protein KGJ59_07420 [Bacteroidota bacterium]|nr:hypothetical protein [Bacteroidota bacterium]
MDVNSPTYLFFSAQPWDNQHSRTRAMAMELSKRGVKTIYVETIPSLANELREKMSKLFAPLRQEGVDFVFENSNLEIWTPPIVPTFFRGSYTPGIDRYRFQKWLERKLQFLSKPIIAVVTMPYWWAGYINQCRDVFDILVFDVQDSPSVYSRNGRIEKRMMSLYEQLLTATDGVLVHTGVFYADIINEGIKVILVRNGAEVISLVLDEEKITAKATKPFVIGTVGRIGANTDLELMVKLAKAFPEFIIENVGTVETGKRMLCSMKNIRLYPAMSREKMIEKMCQWHAGILPYKEEIPGSPLRVYDLLSVPLPIVSTHFEDAEYFAKFIRVANTHDEFINEVRKISESRRTIVRRDEVEKFLTENSWKKKADALLTFSTQLLRNSIS